MFSRLLTSVGMQGGEAFAREALLRSWWAWLIAIAASFLFEHIVVGLVVLTAVLPGLFLHAWAKYRERSWLAKLGALALALTFVGLSLWTTATVSRFASSLPWFRGVDGFMGGGWTLFFPSILAILHVAMLEHARAGDPRSWVWVGAVLCAGLGFLIALPLTFEFGAVVPLVAIPAVLGFKGAAIGTQMMRAFPRIHQEAIRLEHRRLQRDPVRSAGLTHEAVERVYETLVRLVHEDGRVDGEERALLTSFQTKYRLKPSVAAGIEAEVRGADVPLEIGADLAEQRLLGRYLKRLMAQRTPTDLERRLLGELRRAVKASAPRRPRSRVRAAVSA